MALRYGNETTSFVRYYKNALYDASKLNYLKMGEGTTTVWSPDGGKKYVPTPDEYFTFTLLDDDTYSVGWADYSNMLGSVNVPATYNGKAVTQLAAGAFADPNEGMNETLMVVVIPEGITTIGRGAFAACRMLLNVSMPDSLTTIDARAFYMSATPNITIPANVTTIGESAFSNSNVQTIKFAGNSQLATIGDYAFGTCTMLESDFILPNTLTSIGANAFSNSNKVGKIYIPASVTSIGANAFQGTSLIRGEFYCEAESKPSGWAEDIGILIGFIIWDYSLTPSEYFTFTLLEDDTYSVKATDVTNLPSKVGIPFTYEGKAITVIEDEAFYGCTTITRVAMHEDITSIGHDALSGCTNLVAIWLSGAITVIDVNTFSDCKALVEINIPNGLTSIGASAFYGCESLTEIEFSHGGLLTNIGGYAFYNCSGMTSIVIPSSVTTIGEYAFRNCNALTIKCVTSSQPSGWDANWNIDNRPVVWDCYTTA